MAKKKTRKELDTKTLFNVKKEMAKPRMARSVREQGVTKTLRKLA
jgi:hypothetical protein